MAQEQRNILILGASFAGLSAAHYFLKHILPSLPKTGASYHVYLVNPSTQFFWRPAAPRGLVQESLMPNSKMFLSIPDGFKQYSQEVFTFVQGTATTMDPARRTVTISFPNSSQQTILYHALIIATGTKAPSAVLALHTTSELTQSALEAMRKRLPSAKNIVIAGGGPAGVETAGEIGQFLNGIAGWFSSRPAKPKAKITLVTSDKKLLPALRPTLAKQAETYLNKVGVDVIYNTRVESVQPEGAGESAATITTPGREPTRIHLSNGELLEADIYIPATGVKPNTAFVPRELLNERGYVQTNGTTLRVDAAGPRVYALGDVGSYTRGGIMDIYDAVPVCLTNVQRDLRAFAEAQREGVKPPGQDRPYKPNLKETQLVPVGRSKGVGAVFGWKLPSLMVYMIKGRDYFTSNGPEIQMGSKWNKESKWAVDA